MGLAVLVFWDQRLVVLATPKTGSTALGAALESHASFSVKRPPVLKHTTVHRYHRFVGPYLEAASGHRFAAVALMREPRDWLGSWYRYRQRKDVTEPAKRTVEISFDRFVQAYCDDPQPEFAAVGSQARFLRPFKDRGLDRMFRYEDFGSFVDFLADRLGCEIAVPRRNVSPHAPLDLSAETGHRLSVACAEDFALYRSIVKN